MVESIFNTLSDYLYQSFWLAVLSSFLWGILSIVLSPCHLSSIPLIVGFLSSQEISSAKRTFNLSLVFALGILVSIAIIGGITLAAGRLMGDVGSTGNYIVATVFFAVGLYLLDILKLPWNGFNFGNTRFKGYPASFILGLLLGIGLGPCTFAFMAPVLGIVFEAGKSSITNALILLSAFAAGHSFVIILAGTLSNSVRHYLNWSESSRFTSITRKLCGALVILGGVYFIYTTI